MEYVFWHSHDPSGIHFINLNKRFMTNIHNLETRDPTLLDQYITSKIKLKCYGMHRRLLPNSSDYMSSRLVSVNFFHALKVLHYIRYPNLNNLKPCFSSSPPKPSRNSTYSSVLMLFISTPEKKSCNHKT